MRNFNQILILSTCCYAAIALPLSATAESPYGNAQGNMPPGFTPPGFTPPAVVNASPEVVAKQKVQEKFNFNNTQVRQLGEQTLITGVVVNTQDVSASGQKADAAGVRISVQNGDKRSEQPAGKETGAEVKAQGGKIVTLGVTSINTGNINANASGAKAEANAAGTLVDVQGAVVVSGRVNTINHGNVSADATGTSEAVANAAGTRISVQGATFTQIGGTHVIQGNTSATATGGTAIPSRGAAAALDRSR